MKFSVVFLSFFLGLLISGCSGDDSNSSTALSVNDAKFFNVAKSYLTEQSEFGPTTDLSNPNNMTIEFDTAIIEKQTHDNVAHLVSEKKQFTLNKDRTLLMIQRVLPSSLDGISMKVSMRQGMQSFFGIFGREKTPSANMVNRCDRVVVNSVGNAVCLNDVGGSIEVSKVGPKFGRRIISSCYKYSEGNINCYNNYGVVSRKSLVNGVVDRYIFRNQP